MADDPRSSRYDRVLGYRYFLDGQALRDGEELELEVHYREYGERVTSWVRGRFESRQRGARLVCADQGRWFVIREKDVLRRPGVAEQLHLTKRAVSWRRA
jgi:hypothetical protein